MVGRTAFVAAIAILLPAPAVLADDPEDRLASGRVPGLLQVGLAVGHGQALGSAGRGLAALNDLGGVLELALDWRFGAGWAAGTYGSLASYSSLGKYNASYAGAAGLQVIRRFREGAGSVPWLGLGCGWRGYWASPEGPRTSYQGLDLGRVQAGIDVSLSPSVSLSPILGASLSTFARQSGGPRPGIIERGDRRLAVFFLAGLLVRLEVLHADSHGK